MVLAETTNQKAELFRQWNLPLLERVSKGVAIKDISISVRNFDGLINLYCSENNSRFRDGDFLVLHRGDPFDSTQSVVVVIEEDYGSEIIVSWEGDNYDLLSSYKPGWIVDEGMLDLSNFYLSAIDQVSDTKRGQEKILPLLTAEISPLIDYEVYEIGKEQALSFGLNSSQSEATASSYATDLSYLIQGPPGTGKTYVLANLTKMFMKKGDRVLITALTHRAINNALDKIYSIDPNLTVCKIGRPERAKGLKVKNHEFFWGSGFEDLDVGYAVGATPFATKTKRLEGVDFDVVIFDEASQVTLPLALMGMLPASKYIFIGDQKQLPPVARSSSLEIAKQSIFEYLSGRGFDTMLNTTYRLNQELASWPSRTFYQGLIKSHSSAINRKFKANVISSRWSEAFSPDHSFVSIDLKHRNTSTQSKKEAMVVSEIIWDSINSGINPEEIGVVVPYRVQARLIRNYLMKIIDSREVFRKLVIDTVERMQGQEREVVLLSLATSEPGFASGLAEFLFQPQRINVAITRPRTKLIIIYSSKLLNTTNSDPLLQEWIDLFKNLILNSYMIEREVI